MIHSMFQFLPGDGGAGGGGADDGSGSDGDVLVVVLMMLVVVMMMVVVVLMIVVVVVVVVVLVLMTVPLTIINQSEGRKTGKRRQPREAWRDQIMFSLVLNSWLAKKTSRLMPLVKRSGAKTPWSLQECAR